MRSILLCLALAGGSAPGMPPRTAYPRIVIGAWQLLERHQSDAKAVETVKAYVAAGFDTFDTADIYGPSEALLGRAGVQRVFTKFVTEDGRLGAARDVNARSRQALGVVPEMVQFHWWRWEDPGYVDAARNLVTLRDEGLLREVAACNFDTEHLAEVVDAGVPVVANQVQYSLVDLRPENGMLAYARRTGIRLACFGAVAGGLLSDQYLGAPPPARAGTVSLRMYKQNLDRWGDWALFQELLAELRTVADRHATTVANVAVLWVLKQLGPDGGWVVLGVRDTAHIEEHKALAALGELDDEDEEKIRAVLRKGRPPRGDIWSHERR